ncbi:MAG: 7-carboxy-7-deazaguanine synthase QueE [Promethearchaeota archaeon]|nr:MAG: 7-carboxy-7-deazaguanine synthase QueE [Candidatus Lokiarchaeota archaeon]
MNNPDLEGYIAEIFSSIQGEGGTVRGSCFGKRQIFIRFSGCNIANGAFKSTGCFWCDTPQAQIMETEYLNYEQKPCSQEFERMKNPVKISEIIQIVENLITPDLHSISLTGGEPLYQLEFISELIKALNYPLYLETNGSIIPFENDLKELAKYIKYCCCDIKDKSSMAALLFNWENLVNNELEFISKMIHYGVETFAKIVVTSQTQIQDIQWISKKLSEIKYSNGEIVGLAIQPVSLENEDLKDKYSISISHLNEIFHTSAEYLNPENLTLSIQAHKYLKLL